MAGTPMGLPDTTSQLHMTGTATMMTHLLVVAMTRMEPVITTTTTHLSLLTPPTFLSIECGGLAFAGAFNRMYLPFAL